MVQLSFGASEWAPPLCSSTFVPFKSRCMIPSECRWASPRTIWVAKSHSMAGGMCFPALA
eukprot:126333-Prorocentrum_minimum.AAC.1